MKESFYLVTTSKLKTSNSIALVADLHNKPYSEIIKSLRARKPDIIAITGDIINSDEDLYPLDFLHTCSTIAPAFFSLGNHERKITDAQIREIKNTGIIVLDNQWIKHNDMYIGGMTSPFVTEWRETQKSILHYALPNTSWLDGFEAQSGFKILLDHHPENYERATKDRDIDLILSGHAHGGQIRLFGQGLYAPHQGFLPKYTSGVYDNRLVVSRGLSNIKPIPRLWNKTELVYVTIENNKKNEEIKR